MFLKFSKLTYLYYDTNKAGKKRSIGTMDNHKDIFKGLNGDLTEFADLVSSVLECPITLEDANHRLLAYSVHNHLSDPVRISTIISRRVPEKIINSLWKEGYMPRLLKESEPVIIPSLNNMEFARRAAIAVRKNEEVLGFIWALESARTFTDKDIDFLKLAAKEAKNQILQGHGRKNRQQENSQEFVWQLLTGHFESEQEIRDACAKRNIILPTLYSVVVFTFPAAIDQTVERHISYMLTTTQKIKASLYTVDQNRLIILASPSVQKDFTGSLSDFIESFITGMKTRFQIDGIKGGCGQSYESYLKARNTYDEAVYTIMLQDIFPDSAGRLMNFASLGAYQYLRDLAGRQLSNIYQLCLEQLREYDTKNNTNLFSTLKTFLYKDANPHDTANELHLHVNTIHYRLKRIGEITNINMKDPVAKMSLSLEILLMQYNVYMKNKKMTHT